MMSPSGAGSARLTGPANLLDASTIQASPISTPLLGTEEAHLQHQQVLVGFTHSSFAMTGGAHGDGSFTYPGDNGKPLGSVRLANIADGIEDWELFNKLGADDAHISKAADLIIQLMRNETVRIENPALLERVRCEAAERVMASQRSEM